MVRDRGSEVVDRDVVAEHLAGALFARDQWSPGEAQKSGVRQRVAHVERQRVVLRSMGLVGDHDHVVALGDDRVDLTLLGAELLDQGEDVAVILGEQLPQMRLSSVARMCFSVMTPA